MTVRVVIPVRSVSEQPPAAAAQQGTAPGCSEALITCCALAIASRPRLTVHSREHARTLVAQAMWGRSPEQALRWRQFTFEPSWQQRWAWALEVLRKFFPERLGVADLPEHHGDAGLPEIPTACVT